MNPFRRLLLTSLLAAPLLAGAAEHPGAFDFGSLPLPASRKQVVEVRLDSNLLAIAARLAAVQEPEVGALLRGLRQVRVHVVGLDDANREKVAARIAGIRERLDAAGWDRVVSVEEPGQQVAVHVRARGEEAVEGVVVTVQNDRDEAVLVNVVGDIRPEQLAELGERFDIAPLREAGRAGRGERADR